MKTLIGNHYSTFEQPEIFDMSVEPVNVLDFSTTVNKRKNIKPNTFRHSKKWFGFNNSVISKLNQTVPAWAHTIKDIRTIGEFVIVTVAITVAGVTREGIGTGSARNEIGIKNAEFDALKRAANKFGINENINKPLGKDFEKMSETAEISSDPIARSIAELITTKQLGMIRAIARERGIDADAICSDMMKCHVNELTRTAASSLIDRLQTLSQVVEMRFAS